MSLASDFEADLQEALVDEAEHRIVGEQANLIFEFVELAHTLLRAYGERHGYNVEPAIDSVQTPVVDRSRGRLTVRVGWDDEQMARWEFGVTPHTIDGNPILSFIWEDPPQWVRQEFDQGRDTRGRFVSGWRVFFDSVDHPGIPESRAIRDAFNALRRVMES